MNAPRRGRGFVSPGTPCLSVTFPGVTWWLQVGRGDGEGYEEFAPYHEADLGPNELEGLLGGSPRGLDWSELRALPGMPAAVEAEVGRYRLSLHGQRGSTLDADGLVAAFEAFLARAPRRLA